VFGVSKGMWSRESRSCHAGGARGGTAKRGQQQCDVGNAGARQHKVGRAAAQQGSDAWDRREARGGAGLLRRRATARSGSGGQSGGVARRGGASARPGSGGVEAGPTRGRAQSGAGVAGAAHMASQNSGGARQRNRGEGERGRRRRTRLQIAENTGTLL
jgi:hypothetical protein